MVVDAVLALAFLLLPFARGLYAARYGEREIARLARTDVGQRAAPPRYAECAEMERIVSASDLDWTIARFTMLTDQPPTGRIQISRDLLTDPPVRLPRADAARALLDVVADPSLVRCAVNIAARRA